MNFSKKMIVICNMKYLKRSRETDLCYMCSFSKETKSIPRAVNHDLIGPPDPVSNIRPLIFHKPNNESDIERTFRQEREKIQKWNEDFWYKHNKSFFQEKQDYITTNLTTRKNVDTVEKQTLTADEMSVFYKAFLDKNWKKHFWYNVEWYKKNIDFREVLTQLEHTIPSAEFLAIDGEFTGLHSGQNVNAFDTPAQYYTKLRIGGMDFLLIQFGLCVFNYDKEKQKYTHRAYNFYIFPKPLNRSAPDPRFLCQSSSMEFLASQGFDFNKLFKDGIPYLTYPDEERLREDLEERQKARSTDLKGQGEPESLPPIPIPEEHVAAIENVCTRIQEFISSSEPEELELDRYNSFIRKLIYQTVAQRFDRNEVHLESRLAENHNRVLVVTRAGGEEGRKKKEQERQDQELQELNDAVGFSSIIKLISQSGKLIIGHNMLLDLCHVIHQCYAPLPEEYCEFKEMVHSVFPRLLDTKYMCSLAPLKELINSSVLGHMYKTLSEKPFEMCSADAEKEDVGYSGLIDKSHEAGYDAYITGLCFITMANYLGSVQEPPQKQVLPSSPLLQPYINKLFLMRSYDQLWLNLVGDDPPCVRDHVFFISFPKEWKVSDLIQLFSPFGPVYISWLSDRSAYVALHHRDQAALVLKTLTQSDTYAVMTYEAHQQAVNACRSTLDMDHFGSILGSTRSSRWCPTCSGCKKAIPHSPKLATASKRRSIEIMEDSQERDQNSSKRKRSHSFGETFSGRVIEPIPEEEEETADNHSNRSKMKTSSKGSTVKNAKKNNGSSHASCSSPRSNGSIRRKEFEEDDSWG